MSSETYTFERIAMTMYPSASAGLDWRRSRACESGACIMVARNEDSVVFGNTTDPDGPTYSYTTTEWPALSRFLDIALPMIPRPINPIFDT